MSSRPTVRIFFFSALARCSQVEISQCGRRALLHAGCDKSVFILQLRRDYSVM